MEDTLFVPKKWKKIRKYEYFQLDNPSNDEEFNKMKSFPYQEAVGSILYLAQCTRPDVSFSIAVVSQFNQNPGFVHWKAVKRILRYLKGTLNTKLVFTKDRNETNLHGHCDSDWASSFVDRKSCTGYVFQWNLGAISWCSKKQSTVALSTAEAEYVALSAASQDAIALRQLVGEILGHSNQPIEIFCDNKGARDLTETG